MLAAAAGGASAFVITLKFWRLVAAASAFSPVFSCCALLLSTCNRTLSKFDTNFLELEPIFEFDSTLVEQDKNFGLGELEVPEAIWPVL